MVQFRLKHVTTVLDQKKIIDDLSMTVEPGEILALVGHNGAGKSTLLKTMMTILSKESGSISIMETYDQDLNLLEFKRRISYLPEEPMLLSELTVMQHFQLYAMSYDIEEKKMQEVLSEYIDGFDLDGRLHHYPDQLSKGMRQKVQAICALMPEVPVLLIDEPFIGLDVYAQQFLFEKIKEKSQAGSSILLTTHQLDRLVELAHSYLVLDAGKRIEAGNIKDFRSITRRLRDD